MYCGIAILNYYVIMDIYTLKDFECIYSTFRPYCCVHTLAFSGGPSDLDCVVSLAGLTFLSLICRLLARLVLSMVVILYSIYTLYIQ